MQCSNIFHLATNQPVLKPVDADVQLVNIKDTDLMQVASFDLDADIGIGFIAIPASTSVSESILCVNQAYFNTQSLSHPTDLLEVPR